MLKVKSLGNRLLQRYEIKVAKDRVKLRPSVYGKRSPKFSRTYSACLYIEL